MAIPLLSGLGGCGSYFLEPAGLKTKPKIKTLQNSPDSSGIAALALSNCIAAIRTNSGPFQYDEALNLSLLNFSSLLNQHPYHRM